MPRQETPALRGPERIRPAAAPVDTYYRPQQRQVAKPDDEGLTALAKSLSEVAPQLQRYLAEEVDEQNAIAYEEGKNLRTKNQKDYATAVKEGLIPKGANPWLIKGYHEQSGMLLGQLNYYKAADNWYRNSDLPSNDDPYALETHISQFREQWLKENLPGDKAANRDFMRGFVPQMRGVEQQLVASHVAHRQKEIERIAKDNTGIEIGLAIDNLIGSGAVATTDQVVVGQEWEKLGNKLNDRIAGLIATRGFDGTDANDIFVKTVAAKALERRDPTVFKLLEHIKTPGGRLADTTAARVAKLDVEDKLRRQAEHDVEMQRSTERYTHWQDEVKYVNDVVRPRQQKAWERQDKMEAKSDEADLVLSQLGVDLMDKKMPDPALLRRLNAADPQKFAAWTRFHREVLKGDLEIPVNQTVVNKILEDIAHGHDPENMMTRIFSGVPNRTFDVGTTWRLWNEWQEAGNGKDPLRKDPVYVELLTSLRGAVKGNEAQASGSSILDSGKAAGQFMKDARSWKKQNPDAPEYEFHDFLEKRRQELYKRYNTTQVGLSVSQKEHEAANKPEGQTQAPPQRPEKNEKVAAVIDALSKAHIEREAAEKTHANLTKPGAPGSLAAGHYAKQVQQATENIQRLEERLKKVMSDQEVGTPDQAPKTPTPQAIAALKANPTAMVDDGTGTPVPAWRAFEKMFGPGSAAKYMRGK